jgi:hypothetical protein
VMPVRRRGAARGRSLNRTALMIGKRGKQSLRAIAAELETQGHLNQRGKAFAARFVASMLAS